MRISITIIAALLITSSLHAQLTVDNATGNVGIKDGTPEDALTISGQTSLVNSGSRYLVFNNIWAGTLSSTIDINGLRWQVPENGGERMYMVFNYAEDKLLFDTDNAIANGAHLTIEQGGNIGINETDPVNLLHVNGDALFNSAVGNLKIGYPAGDGWGFATLGGGETLLFRTFTNTGTEADGTTRIAFENTGDCGFGLINPERRLHAESSGAGGALRLTRETSSCIVDAGAEINEGFIGTSSVHPFRILTSNSVRMQIAANGDVGIGTISPTFKLHVNGSAYLTGDLTVASDRQIKKDIVPVSDALSVISEIQPVEYSYRTDEFPELNFKSDRKMGLIAQDLEKVLPDLVSDAGSVTKSDGSTVALKSINYVELVPLLIEAVKELDAKVDARDQQIKALEDKVARLDKLEAQMEAIREELGNR